MSKKVIDMKKMIYEAYCGFRFGTCAKLLEMKF